MAITADAELLTIFKTWYSEDKLESLLFRNSPVLKKIQKKRIGGKEYAFANMYGAGGNVSASYTLAVANAASSSKNAEYKVTPGKMFTTYNITQQEILASKGNKAAYEDAQTVKFFAANENIRKGFAACLYGYGLGDVGQIGVAAAQGDTTFKFDAYSSAIKVDVGTKFKVSADQYDPSGTPLATTYTITKMNGLEVTFEPAVVEAVGFQEHAFVFYEGGSDSNGPAFPIGLAQWIPDVADREGATWDGYISQPFFGVNRSVNADRLAGGFILRDVAGNEKYSSALVRGVQTVRRQGGVPDMIIVNDEDWATIAAELDEQTIHFQSINSGGDSKKKNAIAAGLADMSYMFSTSFVENVLDDPYCPKGKAYILDSKVLSFISLSNAKMIDDGVAGNTPGSPDVDVDGSASTNYELMLEDYLDIRPASDTDDGPGQRVSISVYGNFVITNTAHCALVKF